MAGLNLKKYTGSATSVSVPTSVDSVMVRTVSSNAFEGTSVTTVTFDTYANDIDVSKLSGVQVLWNKEPKCTISFDGNGGSGSMASQTANVGIAYTIPECTFTAPSGKEFDKWAIDSTTGTQVSPGDQYAFPNTTATLYAIWSPTYTVTYKAGDGSGSDYVVSSITPGASHTLVSFGTAGFTVPTGKMFSKWALGSTSGTQYAAGSSYTVNENTTFVAVYVQDPSKTQLTFTANTAGSTVSMFVNGTPTLGQNFETSIDGSTWTTFTPGTTTITLTNANDKVYFRGNNPNGVSESSSINYRFVMTGSIAASGNIMSLIDNGACTTTTIPNTYCFYRLFYNCSRLTTAPALPATTLSLYCYTDMFKGCTSLTTPPALPATTLADYCYYEMFLDCTSLTTAPALPATTLASSCYNYMFRNCTSLTTAPALPATTLASYCYSGMFWNCTSLTTAPALPATTLASYCYSGMFWDCTSLTTAPALPATTLATYCYRMMFYNCTSLIVSDTSGTGYTNAWRIPTSGTFSNTYSQGDMFYSCATGSGRSSNNMAGAAGNSYTYYTQNTPVS